MNKQLFLFVVLTINNFNAQEAIVIKPVIDLIPSPMSSIYSNTDFYNKIPLSSFAKVDLKSCPRVHQILFNEKVKILKELKDELLIEAPKLFYQTTLNDNKNNSFWTKKSNVMSLDDLKLKAVDLSKFIDKSTQLLTLIFPFKDEISKITYSAGTNFNYEIIPDNQTHYLIYIFNPLTFCFSKVQIQRKFCITQNYLTDLTKEKKINNFVKIIKKWANLKKGNIPYVWGGCSFLNSTNCGDFKQINKKYENNDISYFAYDDFNHEIKTGFDCSNLILCAAQIAGIPFPFKNSFTISKNLKTIEPNDKIVPGDFIWIPGHIIIISDIEKNLCIEARGYIKNGAGKVQEIALNKLFKNIDNFEILKSAFLNSKKLERLDMKGNVFETIAKFKILKINSAFD